MWHSPNFEKKFRIGKDGKISNLVSVGPRLVTLCALENGMIFNNISLFYFDSNFYLTYLISFVRLKSPFLL